MVQGRQHTFEVAGLVRGVFTMFDRETGTTWNHFDGKAIKGPLDGVRMELVSLEMLTFGEWKRRHPYAVVLSGETGFESRYREFVPGSRVGAPHNFEDLRLPVNALVIGVESGEDYKAYPQELMTGARAVVNDVVGGQPIAVFHDEITGGGLAYARSLNGQLLTFNLATTEPNWTAIDEQTGSTWDSQGRAISGPLAGSQLDWVSSFITEWYGWADFHPQTEILGTPTDWTDVTGPPTGQFGF